MSVPANVARTGAKGDEAGFGFLDGSWRRKWLSGISDIILGHPAVAHTPGILQLDGPAAKCRAVANAVFSGVSIRMPFTASIERTLRCQPGFL